MVQADLYSIRTTMFELPSCHEVWNSDGAIGVLTVYATGIVTWLVSLVDRYRKGDIWGWYSFFGSALFILMSLTALSQVNHLVKQEKVSRAARATAGEPTGPPCPV